MKRINDIAISDEMYREIVNVRNRGSKCYLTRPDSKKDIESWSSEFRDKFCINCEGAGKLGLQVITGGPYKDRVPATEFKGWNEKLRKDDPGPRATFIDGAWYLQKTREYTCPICHGSGGITEMPARTKQLAF